MKYNIREITPQELRCILGACNSIYESEDKESYLIVGNRVNPEEFGLAGKVSESEVLIRVPKRLIDEKGE